MDCSQAEPRQRLTIPGTHNSMCPERRSMGTRTLFVLLAEWGCFACIGEKAQEPVDIILISTDALHADHVGSYSYHCDTTLTLDRLAAEGALFEKVVAESSWTLPTHATMITGLSSLAQPVNHFVGSQLDGSFPTLPVRLKGAGYLTWGISSVRSAISKRTDSDAAIH